MISKSIILHSYSKKKKKNVFENKNFKIYSMNKSFLFKHFGKKFISISTPKNLISTEKKHKENKEKNNNINQFKRINLESNWESPLLLERNKISNYKQFKFDFSEINNNIKDLENLVNSYSFTNFCPTMKHNKLYVKIPDNYEEENVSNISFIKDISQKYYKKKIISSFNELKEEKIINNYERLIEPNFQILEKDNNFSNLTIIADSKIVKRKEEEKNNYFKNLTEKEIEKNNENLLISNKIKILEGKNEKKFNEIQILKKELKNNINIIKILHNNINDIKSNIFFGCLLNQINTNKNIEYSDFSINIHNENEIFNFNFDKIFLKNNEIFSKIKSNVESCLKEGKNLIYFSLDLFNNENYLLELIEIFFHYCISKEIFLYYKLIIIKENNSIYQLINGELIEVNQIKNNLQLISNFELFKSLIINEINNYNYIIYQFCFQNKLNLNGNFTFVNLPYKENELNTISLIKLLGLLINRKTSRSQINFKESKLTSILKGLIDLNSKDFIYLITILNDNDESIKTNLNILKFLQRYNIIF